MKKVYYSVKRYKRNEMIEQKGVGYITDTDLVVACISQNNNPYIRVFEDCKIDTETITETERQITSAFSKKSSSYILLSGAPSRV